MMAPRKKKTPQVVAEKAMEDLAKTFQDAASEDKVKIEEAVNDLSDLLGDTPIVKKEKVLIGRHPVTKEPVYI